MGYSYLSTALGSNTAIAKGTTALASNISFTMNDFKDSSGKIYYQGDTYTGRYIKCNSGILSGYWGNKSVGALFTYSTKTLGSVIPFTKPDSCPMFKCDAYPSSWGDIRKEGPATVYLSNRNEANPSGPYAKGIWYSEDGTTWNLKKRDYYVCFVELVAGGGGGGGGLIFRSDIQEAQAGDGGGGGAYIRVALDLSVTGKVTIVIGGGGTEGTSLDSDNIAGGNGGASSLKTASGITLTCGGGFGGFAGDGNSSAGGQVKSNLSTINTIDVAKGLLGIQPYHGKPGGAGGFISYSIKPDGSAGTAFIAEDVYSSFGILATNKAVVKAGYHGYAGSAYAPYSSYEYNVGGGGAGASAIGGGYQSGYTGSHHGYGGGGNGAAIGYTFKSWGSDEYTYDGAGCSGGNGACIIHYSYRIV